MGTNGATDMDLDKGDEELRMQERVNVQCGMDVAVRRHRAMTRERIDFGSCTIIRVRS